MKRGTTILFRALIVLVGTGALVFLLGEPHLEGRNAQATLFEIYFKDPFLAYAYAASVPFFMALYQAFKVVGYAGRNAGFSQAAAKALRTIRYCAAAVIVFVAIGEVFIAFGSSDDRAGGVFVGGLIALAAGAAAAAAARLERVSQ